jgi:heat shock protein HslJ
MNRVDKIIITLGYLLFFSGCISTSQQIKLSGTRWLLQSMHSQELLEGTAITLKITERGISGFSGCNLYSTVQFNTQPKNRIEINEVANTDMSCPTVLLEEQEKEYINTLPKATNYRRSGKNLFMLDEQGSILLQYRLLPKFEANPEGLIGKTWRLNDADGMEGYELEPFTLRFDGSTFGGTTSCRDYEGTYRTDEDIVAVTILVMKIDGECTQIEQNAEGTYTNLLERLAQYNVSENQLDLYTVQNDKLIFDFVLDE